MSTTVPSADAIKPDAIKPAAIKPDACMRAVWQARRLAREARVDGWVDDHLERSKRHEGEHRGRNR